MVWLPRWGCDGMITSSQKLLMARAGVSAGVPDVTFVGYDYNVSSGGTLTLSAYSGMQVGDMLIYVWNGRNGNTDRIAEPSGYTFITGTGSSDNHPTTYTNYKIAASGDLTASETYTTSGEDFSITRMLFRGASEIGFVGTMDRVGTGTSNPSATAGSLTESSDYIAIFLSGRSSSGTLIDTTQGAPTSLTSIVTEQGTGKYATIVTADNYSAGASTGTQTFYKNTSSYSLALTAGGFCIIGQLVP